MIKDVKRGAELEQFKPATFSSIQGWIQTIKDAVKNSGHGEEALPVQATPTSGLQARSLGLEQRDELTLLPV